MVGEKLKDSNIFLECKPTTFFSRNFKISNSKVDASQLKFNFFGEGGKIIHNGIHYSIVKTGLLTGRWNVIQNDMVIGSVNDTQLFGTYEFNFNELEFKVQTVPFSARFYDIYLNGKVVGAIRPESKFNRKAKIECCSRITELAIAFSFWIIALKSYGYRK